MITIDNHGIEAKGYSCAFVFSRWYDIIMTTTTVQIQRFPLVSPSILEMFSRLCGLSNCITWGLSQVKHCHRWNLPSAGSCRSSRASVGPCDCVRQGPPHLLSHVGVRRQDQQVPKHSGNLQEGQALHKLPRDAEEVWQEDFQLHSKGGLTKKTLPESKDLFYLLLISPDLPPS